jgi:hypothetical protein
MGDEPIGERIRAVEVQLTAFIEAHKQKSGREWAIIMAGFVLILSIAAKNLGWIK